MPIYLGKKHIANITSSVVESSPIEGTNTEDATLSSGDQMLKGVTAYAKDVKYTGTIETVSAPTPTISVSDTGLIAATVDNPKGYQSVATTKIATTQLSTQVAKTVAPSSETQTAVASGVYTTGDVVVSAVPTETKTITANGTYFPTSGKYFSSVEVAITGDAPTYQSKTVSPTEEAQIVIPDAGYDALSDVTVNAIQTESKSVTSNGTYSPTSGKYFSSVTVAVPETTFATQSKTVTPTKATQTVTPDVNYDGMSQVTVEAIPDEYVDTSDATATSSDLVSGTTAYVDGELIKGSICPAGVNSEGAFGPILPSFNYGITQAGETYVLDASGYSWLVKDKEDDLYGCIYAEVRYDQPQVLYPGVAIVSVDHKVGTASASDVIAGVTFTSVDGFNQTGTLVVNNYYTGSSEPSSSLGEDGDLYLMVEE